MSRSGGALRMLSCEWKDSGDGLREGGSVNGFTSSRGDGCSARGALPSSACLGVTEGATDGRRVNAVEGTALAGGVATDKPENTDGEGGMESLSAGRG